MRFGYNRGGSETAGSARRAADEASEESPTARRGRGRWHETKLFRKPSFLLQPVYGIEKKTCVNVATWAVQDCNDGDRIG